MGWMRGYTTAQMVDIVCVKKHGTTNDRWTTEIMEEFDLVAVCRIELAQLRGRRRRREVWISGDGWYDNLIPVPSSSAASSRALSHARPRRGLFPPVSGQFARPSTTHGRRASRPGL